MRCEVRIGGVRYIGLAMLMAFSLCSVAQLSQPGRFEKDQKRRFGDFHIVSLEDQGLALLRDKEKYEMRERLWEFIQLDTALAESWTKDLTVEQKYRFVGHDYRDKNLYYLFRAGDTDLGDLKIIKLDLQAKQVLEFDYKPELAIQLTHFNIVGKQILLAGYVTRQPAVLLYNMENNQAKIVPGLLADNTEILDVRANVNNTFNVLLSERQTKAKKRLILKTFDETGALLLDDLIEVESEKNILSGMTSTLVRDELMLVGTWSDGISKQASGIFSVMVDPYSEQKINYFDFGQLTHFFDYMTPKRAAKTKERSDARRKAGKTPEFRTNVLPIRLLETKNGFVFYAEAYYTTASVNNRSGASASPYGYYPYGMYGYGNPYRYGGYPYGGGYPYSPGYPMSSTSTSAEIKMQMACIAVLDGSGQLITDHGLPLAEMRIPSTDQVSDFIYTPTRTTILFNKDNEIHFQVTQSDGVQLINEKKEIQLLQASETIRSSTDAVGSMRYWYKNVLYLYGYQSIKNPEKGNRDVFFINKLRID
ncbi:MAG: hypothetical protein HOP30_07565 [Cyclobacteriaceae bacterium]|nr:hypothetical protein [Cyclobacteriaceae bacterium]